MKKSFLIFLFTIMLIQLGSSTIYASPVNNANFKELYRENSNTISVFSSSSNIQLTNEDIYLMSQIVYAESSGEPFKGKVAVASVILNRVQNPQFPKTIKGVILQKGAFSSIRNNTINVSPDKDSCLAVFEALKGNDPSNNATFFYNPKIATCKWMKNIAKENIKTIGHHVFFDAK